jgi:uncharacterized protein YraI
MTQRFARVITVLLCVALVAGLAFIVPQTTARADTGSNWTGAYYANPALQGTPVFTRIDPAVVFNWGPNPPGPGLGSQYWSARWITIQYLNAGLYRFTVTVDDGVRLYIDGQLVIDAWRDQAATTYAANVQVSAGNHAIQVDYYQGLGDATIAVSWQYVQTQSTAWTAQYFNNPYLQGAPIVTRLENGIDYFWNLGSPDPFIPADNFSARWTATLPFMAATYRFTLAGDDGIQLFIDDILVIHQWYDHALTAYSIDVPLAGGLHTLRIEYYEHVNQAAVRFSYEIAVGPPPYPGTQSDQWYGEYFANPNLQGSASFVRLDGLSGINFTRNTFPVPSWFPRDNFSVRWTRQICSFPGRPTVFYLTVDDGARFYIDSTLVMDTWRVQSATTYRQPVDLTVGCHILRLEYFQAQIEAVVNLTWVPPDGQTPPQSIGGVPVPSPTGVAAVVANASVLNVRSGPGTNYDILTTVSLGQSMALYQRNIDSSWVRMSTNTGINGWVSARYINITQGNAYTLPVYYAPAPPPGPSGPTGVRGKLTSDLRLRTGPGTGYPQIGIIGWSAVVDVVGRSRDALWLQVNYGTTSGWIYAPYVIIVSGSLVNVPVVY